MIDILLALTDALLFYVTLEADHLGFDPGVLAAGSLVVAVSVVAHGLAGTPGRRWYARAVSDRRSADGHSSGPCRAHN